MSELSIDIGRELRDARGALCLEIAQLSAELCITKRQLLALEENRPDDLPGAAYAIGFLRVYAERLGLDPDALSHEYRLQFGDVDLTPQLQFPEPIPESRIPALSVLVSGSLALAGIYMGWSALSGGETVEANLVPAPPARIVVVAEDGPADPGESPGESSGPVETREISVDAAAGAAGPADEQPAYRLASAATDSGTGKAVDAGTEKQEAEVIPEPAQRSGMVGSALARETPPRSAFEGGRAQIQIRALQDTWVMITDKEERLLMEGVIRSGERYAPPAIPGLRLTTSNAGGLELTIDGRKLGSLGAKGAVVRSVELDPARLSKGGAL